MRARLALLLTVLCAPALAQADVADSYGVSSRAAAMGNAGSATVEGGLAAYYNPAAVWATNRMFSLGVVAAEASFTDSTDVVVTYVEGDPVIGDVSSATETAAGFFLGSHVPFGKRVTLGLLVYHPFQRTLRVQSQDPFIPTYALYDNRQQRFTLNAALGVHAGRGLRLGAGTSILAFSHFAQKFNLPAGQEDENATVGFLGLDIVPRATPTAGVRWDLGELRDSLDGVTVGATFRGPLSLPVDIDFGNSADVVVGAGPSFSFRTRVVLAGTIELVEHYTPLQVALAGAWDREASPFAFVGEVTFMQWSAYEGPYVIPTFDPLVLPPLGELEINWRTPPPAAFRDTLVLRGGAEWRHQGERSRIALRVGYGYEPTPVPEQTRETNILDSNKHVLTAGFGVTFPAPFSMSERPFTFDLHAQYHALSRQTFVKDVQYDCGSARDAPPVGYPCDGEITVGGTIYSGGAALTMEF